MAKLTLALPVILLYFKAVCEGRVYDITRHEEELTGTCDRSCGAIPEKTNLFNCDKITNCRFKAKFWTYRGRHCDWCTCKCHDNEPRKEELVVKTSKTIKEFFLFDTCYGDCNVPGQVAVNKFGCDELRACTKGSRGWSIGAFYCDYCSCKCVTKTNPVSYRLTNVNLWHTGSSSYVNDVNLGVDQGIIYNNYESAYKTIERTIETTTETSDLWEKRTPTTMTLGLTTSIEAPTLILGQNSVQIKRYELSTTEGYQWGSTKTTIKTETKTFKVRVPPRCSVNSFKIKGKRYTARVPFSATKISTYRNGKETSMTIRGDLHRTIVVPTSLVAGECIRKY